MESTFNKYSIADQLLTYHVLNRVASDIVEETLGDILFLQMYFGIEVPRMNIVRRHLNKPRLRNIFDQYCVLFPNERPFKINSKNALRIIEASNAFIKDNVDAIRGYQDEIDKLVEQAN